ncbi:hypothetical protein Scep_004211 [Stephania cephalantha]|uniref:Uncharacterized protein n=1 Tax=Stephania cephalantha TaxID=152367 RepID=A0AAP0KTT8_9MAGN
MALSDRSLLDEGANRRMSTTRWRLYAGKPGERKWGHPLKGSWGYGNQGMAKEKHATRNNAQAERIAAAKATRAAAATASTIVGDIGSSQSQPIGDIESDPENPKRRRMDAMWHRKWPVEKKKKKIRETFEA